MHKFDIALIRSKPLEIDTLEVQSFEMNVYLIKLTQGEQSGFVYDAQDKPMRFSSSQQIRDVFEHCTVHNAVMVHDSPYDEMIGNPNKAEQPMAMPFSMQQPY
jgi:hypothetical protein